MKTLIKAIGKEFKKVFEGNRCRFANECGLYQARKECPECEGTGKDVLRDPLFCESVGIYDSEIKCSECDGVGKVGGLVCNTYFERFPGEDGKAYCRRYRSMGEDEERGGIE